MVISRWQELSGCCLPMFDCRSFAGGVCGKLSEMLDRTSVPLDIKLKLVSIFEHMRFDPDNYEKVGGFVIHLVILLSASQRCIHVSSSVTNAVLL